MQYRELIATAHDTMKLNMMKLTCLHLISLSFLHYSHENHIDGIILIYQTNGNNISLHSKHNFLPRCMECSRGIAMGILSVRLSNACIVTKRKKAMFRFLYHMKEHLS